MAELLRQRVLIDHGSLTVNELMNQTNLSSDEAIKVFNSFIQELKTTEEEKELVVFYAVHGLSKDGFKKISLFSESKLSEINDHFGSVEGQRLHMIGSADFKPPTITTESLSQTIAKPEPKAEVTATVVEKQEETLPASQPSNYQKSADEKPAAKKPEPSAIKKTKQTSMSMFFKK